MIFIARALCFYFEKLSSIFSDINECMEFQVCPANADCVNTWASFKCVCHEGYKSSDTSCIGKLQSILQLYC